MTAVADAIVAAARGWLGTPYHHGGDIRGVGVDCGMLLVRVYVGLGLWAPFDPRPYTTDWHLHRDDEPYLALLHPRCVEVAAAAPGDILALRYGRAWSHAGIVTSLSPLAIVHAYAPARCVLEDEVAGALAEPERAPRAFRPGRR